MGKGRRGGPVRDVAVDLGSSTVLLAVRGRGVLLREPSVAAVDRQTGKVLRAGEEARQMLGRRPGQTLTLRPISGGVLRDCAMAEEMIRAFLQKAVPGRLFKPRLLISVPSGAAQVDEQAVVEAGLRAGARRVYLMEGPLAGALGAGIAVDEAQGHMVVDIGGGTTDVAVIALGGVVASACLAAAGEAFDLALLQYVRAEHGLLISRRTAEGVKIAIGRVGCAEHGGEEEAFSVKGRCLRTGLPRQVELRASETVQALEPVAEELVRGVREVLERTPPELAADIEAEGILLTGGGSLLCGLDRLLSERTGMRVSVAEEPETAVILGLEKTLATLSRRQEGVLDLARRRAVAGE